MSILMMAARETASAPFTPLALFAASEKGWWYDPSDLTTLFQDSAGTTPVTAVGQPVGKVLDKSGNGNHIVMATAGSRPLLALDGSYYYLDFDGVDDYLRSAAVCATGGSAKATMWYGYMPDAGEYLAAYGSPTSGSTGTFAYAVSTTALSVQICGYRGTYVDFAGFSAAPHVVSTQIDLTNDAALVSEAVTLRKNGVAQAPSGASTTKPGAATFTDQLVTIGARDDGGARLNGRIYSSICRFAESTATEIERTETWINERTGAY